ncbi:thyroid adenoma-associated protein homolog isoform X2 [Condylostylus longicornis]|uniref:thyroid adenoma-associated protein homolog isoform X2 n=1 Tax=Condylostylus longicornis TaxID=2530218 RepID=UPI00244E4EBF|nr:thyroid adenoma-associated protein homolog isoform X2 [Condylostylus longicornis]
MNSLNLRVSTTKTTENVIKNAETRKHIVVLPEPINISNDILKKFLEADTIAKQIYVVKEISLSRESTSDDKLEFLIQIYFNSPLKHPVRSQCYKLIKDHSNKEEMTLKLDSFIYNKIADHDNCETLPCEYINFCVTSLSGGFEDFRNLRNVLEKHAVRFLNLIHHSLHKYLKSIQSINSPSAKNELYLFVHNSIRVMLLCFQEFLEHLRNLSIIKIIYTIRTTNIDMFSDVYIPMDIKANIGILLSYISQAVQKYDNWLDEIINYKPLYSEEYTNNCFQLCTSVGILNTLKSVNLEKKFNKIYEIVEKIILIANKYSSESCMILTGTRCLVQFSKTLQNFSLGWKLNEITLCCQSLFNYSFSYFDHNLENIRHMTKDLLRNVLNISAKYELNELVNKIYMFIIQDDVSLSVKCILISNLAKVFGTRQIVEEKYKNILDDFFTTENFERDSKVANCFESLIQKSYFEMDLPKWKSIYINFLIKAINTVNEDHKNIYQSLLEKSIKLAPDLAECLLKDDLGDLELNIKLSVLCTVRKNGIKSDCFNALLQNIPDLKETFLLSSDDTIISALRLIAESHKSTEELTEIECDSLLICLRYHSNSQNPEKRQKLLGLSAKILTRFDINLKKVIKMGRHEKEFRNLHYYFKFLRNLLDFLCQNLFEGSNFSRRLVSLEILKITLIIIQNTDLKLNNFLPENTLNLVFSCLSDSYEHIKVLALDILKIFVDMKYGRFIGHQTLLTDLLVSIKPTDSVTATYYLEFYCYLYTIEEFVKFFDIEQNLIFPLYEPVKFCALKMVLNILQSGIIIGKKSILLAVISNPFYGCLLTIRQILSRLDFDELCKEDIWRVFINDVIIVNKQASNIVAPIVNSSSPEGYFPHDFNEFSKICNEEYTTGTINKINSFNRFNICTVIDIPKPNPQMVLVCAWRTVKEVSLILGDLSLRSTIKKKNDNSVNYLLAHDQILEIGDHFKLLLSETKHRGAFEQAYVGFTKLCSKLWRTDQEELNELPMQWIDELIDIISKDEKINEKICATRRSAGIPFMVQALITSELQVGTTKALKKCMKFLFEICYNKSYSPESKTHSLNILRALFRCTELNEVCNEYIADGIICAIQGYDGNTWSERNSSTLLFAALTVRIFGVQRTKGADNLSIRNKMTGRIFFLRYPKLYDYFLTELKEAKIKIENNEKSNKLHPLLLILSRLYPSALEGTECHFKISMFISLISPCSASRELQTRVLIAKAVAAFVSIDFVEEQIYTILSTLKTKLTEEKGLNSNYFQGLLLQILYIIKPLKQLQSNLISDIIEDLLTYQSLLSLNPVVMRTVFQILLEILKNKVTIPLHLIEQLSIMKRSPTYLNPKYSEYYPIFRKTFCIFNLQIEFLNNKKLYAESFWETQLYAINRKNIFLLSFEETETYLNIILMILFKNTERFGDLISEYECHDSEIDFVTTLPDEFLKESALYFKSSLPLGLTIQEFLEKNENFHVNTVMKTFAILSHLNILKEYDIKQIIGYNKLYPVDLQNSIAIVMNSFLENNKTSIRTNQFDIMQYVKSISQPWNNYSLRLTSSLILKHLFNVFVDNIKLKDETFVSEFSSVVLCLLMDDDIDIRENISKLVLEFCPEYSSKYQNIISTFAQKIFIERLSELLIKFNGYDINLVRRIFCHIIVILTGESETQCENENNDLEVFDKNEINIFAEPQKVVLDLTNIFFENYREPL